MRGNLSISYWLNKNTKSDWMKGFHLDLTFPSGEELESHPEALSGSDLINQIRHCEERSDVIYFFIIFFLAPSLPQYLRA